MLQSTHCHAPRIFHSHPHRLRLSAPCRLILNPCQRHTRFSRANKAKRGGFSGKAKKKDGWRDRLWAVPGYPARHWYGAPSPTYPGLINVASKRARAKSNHGLLSVLLWLPPSSLPPSLIESSRPVLQLMLIAQPFAHSCRGHRLSHLLRQGCLGELSLDPSSFVTNPTPLNPRRRRSAFAVPV
jgi:hypothetical protein